MDRLLKRIQRVRPAAFYSVNKFLHVCRKVPAAYRWPKPALHLYMRVTYNILLTCPSNAPLYDSCLQHNADLPQLCTSMRGLPAAHCWPIPALHLHMRVTYSILLTCPSNAPLYNSCLQHNADLPQLCTSMWGLPAAHCWPVPALHLYMRVTYSTLLTCPSFAPLYEGYLQHTADLSQLSTSL